MTIESRLLLEGDVGESLRVENNIIKKLFTYTACLSYPAVRTGIKHVIIYFNANVLTLT